MKKFLSALLVLTLVFCSVFALAGCSKKNINKFDIVMITDGNTISDGAYNQNAWNGVMNFGDENNMTYRYYQPSVDSDYISAEELEKYISLALKDQAQYIVMQGDKIAVALNELAPKYSDVNFLLVDAYAHTVEDETPVVIPNVMTISFDTLQAGYLAGYSAVAMGNDRLGYLGSVSDPTSSTYGAGYVQGASRAADEIGKPVILEYANYDAEDLDYDYSFTIRPVYQKIEEAKEETFKVNVVDGLGSGVYTDGENVTVKANPAPEGKKFDHWETKSDTAGVKDKKVNISSAKKSTMNLLVEECDCTITAVWADTKTVPVTVMSADGVTPATVYNVEENTSAWVTAPVAESGMVFDHWTTSDETAVADINSAGTTVNVTDTAIELTPVYVKSSEPTFDVVVEKGTGSGAYRSGDTVELIADAPEDGYMFYKWENIDNQGLSTGISMVNEYCYNTSFEMVDRYASIAEAMYDEGTQVIFGGGNPQAISIFTATWEISHQVYGFGYGVDQSSFGNCLSSVVTDYRVAVINALSDYKGGTNYLGNCENGCLYTVGISPAETYTNGDGEEVKDDNYNEGYAKVYKGLAEGTITPLLSNGDVRTVANSKCLTLNYWVK